MLFHPRALIDRGALPLTARLVGGRQECSPGMPGCRSRLYSLSSDATFGWALSPALEPSSPALHCGSRGSLCPGSAGSGLAFWKWLWLLTLAVLRWRAACIMLLPNATQVSLEDMPSLACWRSSQDALQRKKGGCPSHTPHPTTHCHQPHCCCHPCPSSFQGLGTPGGAHPTRPSPGHWQTF